MNYWYYILLTCNIVACMVVCAFLVALGIICALHGSFISLPFAVMAAVILFVIPVYGTIREEEMLN